MSVPPDCWPRCQQTQLWLKTLCNSRGYAGETEALAVLRAVLHQLRDTLQGAVDLGARRSSTKLRGGRCLHRVTCR